MGYVLSQMSLGGVVMAASSYFLNSADLLSVTFLSLGLLFCLLTLPLVTESPKYLYRKGEISRYLKTI